MSSWISHYIIAPNGEPQDFKQARALVQGDMDAEWYVESMIDVLQGKAEPEDGVEQYEGNSWVAEYHNGVGDGGSQWICNTEWIARDFPQAFKALGVKVSWSEGYGVFAGKPDGTA